MATSAHAADEETPRRVALSANVGASIVDPGIYGALGARFMLSPRFLIGIDTELNGWYGVNGSQMDLGSANFYASGIFRWPLRRDFALRTTLSLGAAVEIADLYGVPSGSVGFFAGVRPLGVEWRFARRLALVFDPLGFAIPVTHLTGAPFGYPQFRTQLGVELAL